MTLQTGAPQASGSVAMPLIFRIEFVMSLVNAVLCGSFWREARISDCDVQQQPRALRSWSSGRWPIGRDSTADEPVRIKIWVFAIAVVECVASVNKASIPEFLVAANDHLVAVETAHVVEEEVEAR